MELECFVEIKERISEANSIGLLADEILKNPIIGTAIPILDQATNRRATANAMTKSALVLLCGYFEGYLKKIVQEFSDILNDIKAPIGQMSDPILLALMENSVQGDKNKCLPRVTKLKNSITTASHHPFDHKILGGTKGNPTVDVVESIFDRIGIKDVIDKLSIVDYAVESTYTQTSQIDKRLREKLESALSGHESTYESIAAIIEERWNPRQQRRPVGYVGVIQELLKTRNRIAHGENFGEQVTPAELFGYSQQLEKLCKGLNNLIVCELARYGAGATLPVNQELVPGAASDLTQ